jgi:uncharacterized protein YdhG (YjbR/CyaY superfamily)
MDKPVLIDRQSQRILPVFFRKSYGQPIFGWREPQKLQQNYQTIDEYIKTFPPEIQSILEKMRLTIRKAAPEATEAISYRMPTFKLNGNLVHFAAYKQHIGFYPTPSGIEAFKTELSPYEGARGSVRFPLDKPIPFDLVARIVIFRVKENLKKKHLSEGR